MSQLTRDRLLAALGVPRASRDELGELSYEGRADLLGCKTRLSAVVDAERVNARCEMQTAPDAGWTMAWEWDIRSTADGRMRLARSERAESSARSSDLKAPGSIEEAKTLARAAILQIRTNPHWTKTGLACAPAAEMPSFAALAQEKGDILASDSADRSLSHSPAPRAPQPRKTAALAAALAIPAGQAALFGDEPAASHAFKR